MIVDRLRARSDPHKLTARRLHAAAVAQARRPALFASMGIADTPEGRFEALTLHILVLIDRLNRCGREAALVGQALFDVFIRDLDGALREMGVGDLAVGGKMRKLGAAFYGRAKAFEAAFARLPDPGPLQEVVVRTLLEQRREVDPSSLADYARRCHTALGEHAASDLLAGSVRWPEP